MPKKTKPYRVAVRSNRQDVRRTLKKLAEGVSIESLANSSRRNHNRTAHLSTYEPTANIPYGPPTTS